MGNITNILFDLFWIITGVTANFLVLTILFILFCFVWSAIKAGLKKGDNENE